MLESERRKHYDHFMGWSSTIPIISNGAAIKTLPNGQILIECDPKEVKGVAKKVEQYKQYESHFSDIWYDSDKIGLCEDCGLSDAPIAYGHPNHPMARCVWCAEMSNLNHHLRYNGSRRFRKTSKWSYDGDHDSAEYFQWLAERKKVLQYRVCWAVACFCIMFSLIMAAIER